jgi:D-threo-aldose 1-dehydrogenase
MDPTARRTLGSTGIEVTQLGLGGASIGELFVRVPELDAFQTVRAAWDAGVRYFDTAPWYGRGLSELRMGAGLRGEDREAYTLSSKIGRWLRAPRNPATFTTAPWAGGSPNEVVFDYSYDGIMRGFEQSQQRLGITRLDVAWVHDLDHLYHGTGEKLDFHFGQLAASGWRAVDELKAAGLIRAVGAGINDRGLMTRFLDLVPVDAFLVAMPYTLLDQGVLDDEFPACEARGIGFVIGSPFASGILAKGDTPDAKYAYAPASDEVRARVRGISAVCERHGAPLAAAALQFPLGHRAVASVIPGASSPAQAERNVAAFTHPIPVELWAELKHEGLLREDAPVPA